MKTFYWNVDTQKDFMDSDGKLYVEGAEKIKPKLKKIISHIRSKTNYLLIHTADEHFPNSEEISNTPDFKNTFPPHCMYDTDGQEQIPETKVIGDHFDIKWYKDYKLKDIPLEKKEYLITKDMFDFVKGNKYSSEFIQKIKKEGYTNVVVFGVASNVCVLYAVENLKKYFNVSIVTDCIKDIPHLDNPMEKWENDDNINLISLKELKS